MSPLCVRGAINWYCVPFFGVPFQFLFETNVMILCSLLNVWLFLFLVIVYAVAKVGVYLNWREDVENVSGYRFNGEKITGGIWDGCRIPIGSDPHDYVYKDGMKWVYIEKLSFVIIILSVPLYIYCRIS